MLRGDDTIPAVSASATRNAEGVVHLSLVNTNPQQAITVNGQFTGSAPATVAGRVLTASEMNAHNTFDEPNAVCPQPLAGAQLADGRLTVDLPPKSVVLLELQ